MMRNFTHLNSNAKIAKLLMKIVLLRFNKATIHKQSTIYPLELDLQFDNIDLLNFDSFMKSGYIFQRALSAYTASNYRPGPTLAFSAAAQVTKPKMSEAKTLKRAILLAHFTKDQTLRIVALDVSFSCMVVFVDTILEYNFNCMSQFRFVICFMAKKNSYNIVCCSCSKYCLEARNDLVFKVFALVNDFDYVSTMRVTVNEY